MLNKVIKFTSISKYFLVAFIIFAFFSLINAQNSFTIMGKVTDKKTGAPLPIVNVYLSETAIGSTTDENGNYSITGIPEGKYSLVVSIIGYKPVIKYLVLKGEKELTQNFSLIEVIYNLDEINVKAELPKKWLNQLEFFRELFLGNNQFAGDCIIENETKLEFYEDENYFKASINEPLLVLNNALGYKINCVIRSFSFNKVKKKISMEVYPGFTEITTSNADTTDQYYNNREKSYTGSLAHFLTLLTDSTKNIYDEGFVVSFIKDNRTHRGINSPKLSVIYNPQFDTYVLNPSHWGINSPKLLVIYNPQFDTYVLNPSQLTKKRYDFYVDGILINYSNIKDHVSRIDILHDSGAEFDPAGYFLNVGEFAIQGYMAGEGIATMLPRFYKPNGEINND